MFFCKILQLEKFQGADFKYDISIFKILGQKYPNKAFLVSNTKKRHCWWQIEAFLFFRETLQFDKFEDGDIRYKNIIFKFQSKNIQIKHFWSPIKHFIFFRKILQIDKIEDAGFKYDNRFSKCLIQNHQNKAFLVKNTQIKHFWSQT